MVEKLETIKKIYPRKLNKTDLKKAIKFIRKKSEIPFVRSLASIGLDDLSTILCLVSSPYAYEGNEIVRASMEKHGMVYGLLNHELQVTIPIFYFPYVVPYFLEKVFRKKVDGALGEIIKENLISDVFLDSVVFSRYLVGIRNMNLLIYLLNIPEPFNSLTRYLTSFSLLFPYLYSIWNHYSDKIKNISEKFKSYLKKSSQDNLK